MSFPFDTRYASLELLIEKARKECPVSPLNIWMEAVTKTSTEIVIQAN
jgi:hypothetical protein